MRGRESKVGEYGNLVHENGLIIQMFLYFFRVPLSWERQQNLYIEKDNKVNKVFMMKIWLPTHLAGHSGNTRTANTHTFITI